MTAASQRDNRRGILLMSGSMAGFAVEDMFIKRAAADLPAGQILAFLGLFGAILFGTAALRQGVPILTRAALRGPMLVRNLTEVSSSTAFIIALAHIPLSTYSAILQAAPLLVTLGAALFLGEKVGWRRWTAISVGLLGVLLIIRPGSGVFDPAVLVCVLGVALMSVRDLSTRAVPAAVSSTQLAVWAFLGILAAGLVFMAVEQRAELPTLSSGLSVGAAMLFGTISYYLLIRSMRAGEVSVIAPFRYTRIVFALILAMLVLGERPDGLTLAGAAIVVASGLYTVIREARLKRLRRTSPEASSQV